MNRILEIAKANKEESNRREERRKKIQQRKEGRKEKVENRRSYRLEKIKEVTAKAYAVAKKRKWLVFLIGIGLIAYLVISNGGLGLGGILDKVKGLF
tara:strand:+ start:596 stop:886 length:291 start_codon:yes stop_codon:yes gene_type:complete